MNDRPRRLILLLVGLSLTLFAQLKGRAVSPKGDVAAFLPSGAQARGQIIVRLQGDCVQNGVYAISSGVDPKTVIKMAMHASGKYSCYHEIPKLQVCSGDAITISAKNGQHVDIKKEKLQVIEEMLLGVPLDPNRLDISDWENLPGVGPTIANRIVSDRQKYGDFSSIKDLQRVPGIGEKKVKQVERYFQQAITP